jgi:UDP-2,4-diacetamido-2,4,6-trideoxy-beta-L-altropyranose hydrolase
MPFAVFRADASPAIGGGHVMRCLTLANALAERDWQCAFATCDDAERTVPALCASRHERFVLTPETESDANALKQRWRSGVDALIVDHYGLDAEYENDCRSWVRNIVAIDDLANRPHSAEILVDQTPGRRESEYRHWVPLDCTLLLGAEYALLRPEFAAARDDTLTSRRSANNVGRVLISLGATDPDNVTGAVLDAIHFSGLSLNVDVILGAGAPHRASIGRQLQSLPGPSTLHIDPPVRTIISLIASAQLAIGAAGGSAWERCCLGLPTLVIVLADNQRQNAEALQKAGAGLVVGESRSGAIPEVTSAIHRLSADRVMLDEMSRHAAMLCDGRGVDRVAARIEHLTNGVRGSRSPLC